MSSWGSPSVLVTRQSPGVEVPTTKGAGGPPSCNVSALLIKASTPIPPSDEVGTLSAVLLETAPRTIPIG
jgi:hypothetical protein